MLKTLADMGFDDVDAQIYVYLSKKGVQKASDICKALNLAKQQFYLNIKRLQSRGIVASTLERPARFSVMPFEKVLDSFIKTKMEETRQLQQSKAEILSNWENLRLDDKTPARFTVIQGRNFIFSKIQQMIQETKNRFLAITTVPAIAQTDQRGVFKIASNLPSKSEPQFRFLAELTPLNASAAKKLLDEIVNNDFNIEVRNLDLGLALFPQMFVRDDAEALFFTKPRAETSVIELDDICLWTDCNTLANAFIAVFEDLWHNSTEIQQKIEEFETGRPTPKTATITDAEMAKKKFHTTLQSAKKEITILTSCMGLQGLSKYLPEFKKLREKRVAIKIMSPIVTENLKASKQLSKLCSIRHVPPNYTPTTIIDKQYLFQFSASNLREKLGIQPIHFENTLFTTNPEYIKKNTTMLREIWKNSRPPSADNLTALFGPYVRSQAAFAPGAIRSPGPDGTYHPLPPNDSKTKDAIPIIQIQDEDPEGKMTEQDVLKEIIKVQQSHQSPDTLGNLHIYSSQGIAVIHPPDFFKLPPFLIRVHHIDKHSTYGAEDVIMINLWLETDSGPAYVPVAVFGDNSTAQDWWKRHFEATPAGKNVQLSRKDELQVWIHGNTLFAAWTIPIILYPSHYILPPACILFEGYGKVKTEAFSIIDPLGGKATAKQNGFDAFVTFMHQSSKYSGPGTDGFLVRDFVMELTPQFIDEFHPTMETNLAEKRKTESTSFKNGRVKMQ